MSPTFERRIREHRARMLVRSLDYRQRRHARGVWFRLRRVLAEAGAAFVIPEDEARTLIAEGHRPEPVGQELEPPKLIVMASSGRIARIASAQPVPMRLGGELLTATCLALTPFETTG
jgi:hypothetical protein